MTNFFCSLYFEKHYLVIFVQSVINPEPSKILFCHVGIEKRRSGRNTKRTKYVDDVEYNFSEEELKRMPKEDADVAKTAAMEDILGPEEGAAVVEAASADNSLMADSTLEGSNSGQSGPNYAFVVRNLNIFNLFSVRSYSKN